jgi:magnesium transporter
LLGNPRTHHIVHVNPTQPVNRKEPEAVRITVYNYNEKECTKEVFSEIESVCPFHNNDRITWINIDGLRKSDVEKVAAHYGIHALIVEDILSLQQRPKMDEVDDILYCLLNMLYYNGEGGCVEHEQVSIVLGKNFVITFQEDPDRDVFNDIRAKLQQAHSKLRQRGADFLAYTMLDLIVDNYFLVMEKLGERIENIEEVIVHSRSQHSMSTLNNLRKELIVLKRNLAPVRDMISNIMRSESPLLEERTTKYFKDVHDHILQAYDLSENYRDILISMQDLNMNNLNLRMNEVMKVMAIVTCLMAPATVIGGIFGMNFDIIPTAHNQWGFYTAVGLMLIIPVAMLIVFKKRGWF